MSRSPRTKSRLAFVRRGCKQIDAAQVKAPVGEHIEKNWGFREARAALILEKLHTPTCAKRLCNT